MYGYRIVFETGCCEYSRSKCAGILSFFSSPLIYSAYFSFVSTADTESMEPGAIQDILTCGLCQKTFALADIVKFIQHKVLQCNKENYEQCFTQGKAAMTL